MAQMRLWELRSGFVGLFKELEGTRLYRNWLADIALSCLLLKESMNSHLHKQSLGAIWEEMCAEPENYNTIEVSCRNQQTGSACMCLKKGSTIDQSGACVSGKVHHLINVLWALWAGTELPSSSFSNSQESQLTFQLKSEWRKCSTKSLDKVAQSIGSNRSLVLSSLLWCCSLSDPRSNKNNRKLSTNAKGKDFCMND